MDETSFNRNRKALLELFIEINNMHNLFRIIEHKMTEAADLFQFETAARYRDILKDLKYINYGIWHYQELMSRDILLKIPILKGYKLFMISGGSILIKKSFKKVTSADIDCFVHKGSSLKENIIPGNDEKSGIDYRDILYSEISALPKESVILLS